jgi:hypothetical protein
MATTPIRPQDAPPSSITAQPGEQRPQAEDVARFEGALSQTDKDAPSQTRDEVREEDRRSDDPSSLFRRREAPDRDQGGKGDGGEGRREKTPAPDQQAPEPGASPLQGMALPAGILPLASPAIEPMTPAARVAALANEIVDALRVAQTGPGGTGEVRIKLNSAVLDGSEVRLVNAGKALELTFVCATKDAETFLLTRQAEMSALLGERLSREVRIQVTDPSRDEAARTRHEADARGGRDGGEDQGRSRNRHLYDTGKDA